MKHTPGPWKYEEEPRAIMGRIVSEHLVVAGIPTPVDADDSETLPNAHLIAAAPETHELLIDARNRLVSFIGSDCECDNTHEQNGVVCCLCQYDEAINKAKGV